MNKEGNAVTEEGKLNRVEKRERERERERDVMLLGYGRREDEWDYQMIDAIIQLYKKLSHHERWVHT